MPDETIGSVLFGAYGRLAMAHAAYKDGATRYEQRHFIIRSRLTAGLRSGNMSLGSFLDDDRVKMSFPRACCYCGCTENLTLDHLLPKSLGGPESADNTVWACRSCNSSKGKTDVLVWLASTGRFPPLLLLRRYLKLAIRHCEDRDLLGTPVAEAPALPFALDAIPTRYPEPPELQLWVVPDEK